MSWIKYVFIGLFVVFFMSQLKSQSTENSLKFAKKFFCYEWLPEFQDTIWVVLNEDMIIAQKRSYCVIQKMKRKKYDLWCWTGKPALETPTEWKSKLRVRFKKDIVKFRFGKQRFRYKISKNENKEEYLLIKFE